MQEKFTKSSPSNPCPVCERTKDGDCRIGEDGNFVLCHTHQSDDHEHDDYIYSRHSSKAAGYGVWVRKKPKKINYESRQTKKATYVYSDVMGQSCLKVEKRGKQFYQFHYKNGEWLTGAPEEYKSRVCLYRWKEIKPVIDKGSPFYFVEGEACADALWKLGLPATTSIGGSKNFSNYGNYSILKSARVILVPDRDIPGMAYMEEVAESCGEYRWLKVFPESPVWRHLPSHSGLDVEDWIELGATAEDIKKGVTKDHPVRGKEEENKKKDTPTPDEAMHDIAELRNLYKEDWVFNWYLKFYVRERNLLSMGINERYLLEAFEASQRSQISLADQEEDYVDICNEADEERPWIIKGLIPGRSVIVLCAEGGTGKTSLCYHWEKHLALGAKWSGLDVDPGKSYNVQNDEPRVDLQDKIRIQEYWNLPKNTVIGIRDWKITQWEELKERLNYHKPRLVMIDSFTSVHTDSNLDLTKSSGGNSLYKFRDFADQAEWNMSFVIIHHTNKAGTLRDSSSIKDNVSGLYYLYWPGEELKKRHDFGKNELVLDIDKSRAGLNGQHRLRQNPVDYSWEYLGLVEEDSKLDSVCSYLKDADRKMSASEIKDAIAGDLQGIAAGLERGRKLGLIESEWRAGEIDKNGSPYRFRVYWVKRNQSADDTSWAQSLATEYEKNYF